MNEQTYKQALLNLMQGLSDIGFGAPGRSIDGADAIDEINRLLLDTQDRILAASDIKPKIIYSPSQHGEGEGFWNTHDGWVELDEATLYYVEVSSSDMPSQDAQLLSKEEAEAIDNDAPPRMR